MSPIRRSQPPRQLVESGVMPILRAVDARHVPAAVETLASNGVTCLEVTTSVPGAVSLLPGLKAGLPENALLGVGTVTRVDQAEAAAEAGADFLVMPAVCEEVLEFATRHDLPCYPGAWTPTEVWSAWQAGATAVKLFPAATGGLAHLRAIRDPLPDIPLVPTGGVALDTIGDWIAAGALAVGLGSPLLGDALAGGSLTGLAERARRALDAVAAARAAR